MSETCACGHALDEHEPGGACTVTDVPGEDDCRCAGFEEDEDC
jgi:hypothetical protein